MNENLLPVLASDVPANTLCASCPKPGACCKNFVLNYGGQQKTFWKSDGIAPVLEFLDEMSLPFHPIQFSGEYTAENGELYVTYSYDCPELKADGRCGIYESRPHLCKTFTAGSGELCVFYNLLEKGK
jgi:Fe-S-cluster containining protein